MYVRPKAAEGHIAQKLLFCAHMRMKNTVKWITWADFFNLNMNNLL